MKHIGFAVLLLTLLTGCVHSSRERTSVAFSPGTSHLVYFQPEPHRSLYVEVDAVEGTEFSETELNALEAILREWTKKPAGVSVVKSSTIPRSAARRHSADGLARRYMEGPIVATNDASPAYIYLLVYDNRVNRNPTQSPRGASLWPAKDAIPSRLAKPEDPHVVVSLYRAMIYIDRSSLGGGLLPQTYWYQTLIHEAGHVLGLVTRESRANGYHCPTNWCVMQSSTTKMIRSDIMNWLKRQQPKPLFCDACTGELRQFQRSAEAPITTRFVGPVLVRTMPLYQVLSLPGLCGLYIVDSIEDEIPRFMEEFRNVREEIDGLTARISGRQEESVLQAIDAAKQDIHPPVRAAARKLESHIQKLQQKNEKGI